MIDTTPGHHPDDIHDLEGNVYIILNTKELFGARAR
jgi:hypothetical protein